MRLTITPIARPQDSLTLHDGHDRASWDAPVVLGVIKDGLEGWTEGVAPRVEAPEIPRGHGTYPPDEIFLESRIVTVRFVARASRARGASSTSIAALDDTVAGLVGEYVEIAVEDASGIRRAEGYVSTLPVRERRTEWKAIYTLVISCPDPLKYGTPVLYPVTGGAAVVQNAGTGDVWPRVLVSGRVRSLDVTFGGRRVTWTGDSTTGLVLDMRTAIPLDGLGRETGLLRFAQTFRVPPGESRIAVDSDASVQVEVTPGWK